MMTRLSEIPRGQGDRIFVFGSDQFGCRVRIDPNRIRIYDHNRVYNVHRYARSCSHIEQDLALAFCSHVQRSYRGSGLDRSMTLVSDRCMQNINARSDMLEQYAQ
eukprot:985623-Prorocentrum_minimum.AAC.3